MPHDSEPRVSRRQVLKSAAAVPALGVVPRPGPDTGAVHSCGDDRDGPRTFPRATTRGHFENRHTQPTLDDQHTKTGYETAGDFTGVYSEGELLVFVHGWATPKEYAIDAFYTASQALSANGYDKPVVGFSYSGIEAKATSLGVG